MYIFQIFLILNFAFCTFVLIKNEMVYHFEIFLVEKCYIAISNHTSHIPTGSSKEELEQHREKYIRMHQLWDEISDISHAKMIFSFKPLKPEYWLNEEQLEFINNV